jgi:hypothetical protein
MKNTENQSNIGQGISNHFYTQQIIDAKSMLIKDLIMPIKKDDAPDRTKSVAKIESLPPVWVLEEEKENSWQMDGFILEFRMFFLCQLEQQQVKERCKISLS